LNERAAYQTSNLLSPHWGFSWAIFFFLHFSILFFQHFRNTFLIDVSLAYFIFKPSTNKKKQIIIYLGLFITFTNYFLNI